MKRMTIAFLLLASGAAQAQDVQWTQMVDVPKGANLPSGVTVDILGIAPGDSYEEAKAKLEAIIAQPDDYYVEPRIQEYRYEIFLTLPGGQRVTASYVGAMKIEITRMGTKPSESISVALSAPSSGYQVVAVDRHISYSAQAEQPRISAVLDGMSARMGSIRRENRYGSGVHHIYRFDDEMALGDDAPWPSWGCDPVEGSVSEADLDRINPDGTCDVVFKVEFGFGLSDDHARSIWFKLGDNARARENFTADYQFFRDYVTTLQDGAGAEAPKL